MYFRQFHWPPAQQQWPPQQMSGYQQPYYHPAFPTSQQQFPGYPPPQHNPYPWGNGQQMGAVHGHYNYGGFPPYGGGGYNQPYSPPMSGMLANFQTKDGKFDFNKAFTTVDQVMKTANQISPLMKQVGSLFTQFTP